MGVKENDDRFGGKSIYIQTLGGNIQSHSHHSVANSGSGRTKDMLLLCWHQDRQVVRVLLAYAWGLPTKCVVLYR